ncbi:hypothetical protein PG988_010637 [Apiospora saccharicola]
MAGLSTKPSLDNLPAEVLHLILREFCQHCRGERMGCAPDFYFDRDADQPSGLTSLIANFLVLLSLLEEVSLHEESGFYNDEDYIPSALQQIEKLALKSLEVTANAEDRSYRLVSSGLSRLARRILELSTDFPMAILTSQVTPETLSFYYTLGLPKLSLKHLQTLHVTESWLGAEEIQYTLGACTGLREFVYEVAEVYTAPRATLRRGKNPCVHQTTPER